MRRSSHSTGMKLNISGKASLVRQHAVHARDTHRIASTRSPRRPASTSRILSWRGASAYSAEIPHGRFAESPTEVRANCFANGPLLRVWSRPGCTTSPSRSSDFRHHDHAQTAPRSRWPALTNVQSDYVLRKGTPRDRKRFSPASKRPLMHAFAAKALLLPRGSSPSFRDYARR